jgi:D-lactate dehydrogenase (cytochrome)
VIGLRRGELHADDAGRIRLPVPSGAVIEAQLPSYQMPHVRKHASGYFVAPEMDIIDLFIGSEGTLGVIVEAELQLLPKPAGLLSGVVFFDDEQSLLPFVRSIREQSLAGRGGNLSVREGKSVRSPSASEGEARHLDARAVNISITSRWASCVKNIPPFRSSHWRDLLRAGNHAPE